MTKGPEIWFPITKICYTEGSLYRENLHAVYWPKIQGTGLLVCSSGKFVIREVRFSRIPMC